MEINAKTADTHESIRQLLIRHGAHYETSPYFVVQDVRTFGSHPTQRRIQAGFEIVLYEREAGPGELQAALDELCAACREAIASATEFAMIEVIPAEATLVFNAKEHFEPEALVRIRITHASGFDQPAGASEEAALEKVTDALESLGVRRT